jgi:ABC-type multidrug transport system ATPase subunit
LFSNLITSISLIYRIFIEELIIEDDEAKDLLNSCEVGFEGIKLILKQKGSKPDRVILDGSLKGKASPGRMLAVMGPSGSGKSSLIHAVAGRIKQDKKLTLSGERYVNGQRLSGDSILPAAFIEQDVNFFPHMTVKETLDFRVELKLGSKLSKSGRDDVVSNLMDILGLKESEHTIVGNAKVRGLSGGERKRLSIACELISSPPVIVLDEPTSGLDSYQATQLTGFLRKLADSGKTIIAVIHQPSQQVFSMFDDLVLVSEGHMMYYGEIEKVRSYLQSLGYPCTKDTGTAEYVLNCISRTNGGPEEQKKSTERIEHISSAASRELKSLTLSNDDGYLADKHHHHKLKLVSEKKGPAAGILRQFKLLLTRSFREVTRGKGSIIIKLVQQVSLGLIYGGIFKVGNDQVRMKKMEKIFQKVNFPNKFSNILYKK